MIVINFAHPLTESQKARIAELTAQRIDSVVDVRSQFDPAASFVDQAIALVDGIQVSPEQWQTAGILVNPPSLAPIACLVLAELHGRTGYFPPLLRLRPTPNTVPPAFEVAEILDLQSVRERARGKR